jgi:hypothetical protein
MSIFTIIDEVHTLILWGIQTCIRQHLFEVSCLHSAYTSKMGYRDNSATHCIILSQRTELNRQPTDYELQIGIFRKVFCIPSTECGPYELKS